MTSACCEECASRDIFADKELGGKCECLISEDLSCHILDTYIKRWCGEPPKAWTLPESALGLLSIGEYEDDFINGRDKNIEDAILRAAKYLFGGKEMKEWGYLDIGCGTCIPTLRIATELQTHPLGIDWVDRRKTVTDQHFTIVDTEKIPFGDDQFDFITACDILHHVPNPENLVLEALKSLAPSGSLLVMDLDCTSWEEAYYLDLLHAAYASAVGGETSGNYLSTFGYRSRRYWRNFMKERGYMIVYSTDLEFYTYIDVYQFSRSEVAPSGSQKPK